MVCHQKVCTVQHEHLGSIHRIERNVKVLGFVNNATIAAFAEKLRRAGMSSARGFASMIGILCPLHVLNVRAPMTELEAQSHHVVFGAGS